METSGANNARLTNNPDAGLAARGKPRGVVLLRLGVSVLLIGYIVWRTNWADVGAVLGQSDPLFVALSFLIGPVLVSSSSWKWSMLLNALGVRVRLIQLYVLYEIGGFFGNVLPTNVGGDVVRATSLARATARYGESVSSIFVERYTGLAALVLMALVSVPLNLDLSLDPRVIGSVAFATGGYIVLLVLVVNPNYLPWLWRRPLPGPASRLLGKIQGFQADVRAYRNHPRVLFKALLVSLLWNVGATLNVYLSARALGGDVSFAGLLVTVPLILTITMVPISLGGIGLSEWAYMFAFTQIGVGAPLGLSVALLLRVKSILTGGLGAGFFALGLAGFNHPAVAQPAPVAARAEAIAPPIKADWSK